MSEYKLCIVGDNGVGKSATLIQLIQSHYVDEYDPYIDDSYRKRCSIDNETCLLDIYESCVPEGDPQQPTALSMEFSVDHLSRLSLPVRTTQGIVIVFDIANRGSFEGLNYWLEKVLHIRDMPTPVMIMANKCDLPRELHETTADEIEEYANSIGAGFVCCSAKERFGIEEGYFGLVRLIRQKQEGSFAGTHSSSNPGKALKNIPQAPKIVISPCSNIGPNLRSQLNNQEFCDLILRCKKAKEEGFDLVYVHRVIVATRGPTFWNAIQSSLKQEKQPNNQTCFVVDLPFTKDAVIPFLTFLYVGIIDVPQRFAKLVLEVSEHYKHEEFSKYCRVVAEKGWYPSEVNDLNNRQQALLTAMNSLPWNDVQRAHQYTDVKVYLSNGKFMECHKVVLAARSKYFLEQFQASPKRKEFLFPDVRPYPTKIKLLLSSLDLHCSFDNKIQQQSKLMLLPAELLRNVLSNFECDTKEVYLRQIGRLVLTCKDFRGLLGNALPRLNTSSKAEEDTISWIYAENTIMQFKQLWSIEKLLMVDVALGTLCSFNTLLTSTGMPPRFKQLIEFNLNQMLQNEPIASWFKIYRLSEQYNLIQLHDPVLYYGAINYQALHSKPEWKFLPTAFQDSVKEKFSLYKGGKEEKCLIS